MPYRHAWAFLLALILATAFAFWRTYFGRLLASPTGFHIHGVTASLWLLLLLAQSWTPHHGRLTVHRQLGRAMLVAVPVFAMGAMGVIHSMAAATAAGDPFYALWGARLALMDLLAFGAVLYAAGMALRHRRTVRLHAGYMLSTALPLVSPVLGRVFNQHVPGLVIRGPQDFPVFGGGVQLANLVAGTFALWLWWRDPAAARPWRVALGVVAVQIVAFEFVGATPAWHSVFRWLGGVPLPALLLAGLALGTASVRLGWRSRPLAAPRRTVAL